MQTEAGPFKLEIVVCSYCHSCKNYNIILWASKLVTIHVRVKYVGFPLTIIIQYYSQR